MKQHAVLGFEIVESAGLPEQARWVRHHHERLDGRGYPDGLSGEEIPLESRIILVADSFEAMTSDRPYRRAPAASSRSPSSSATPGRSSIPTSSTRSPARSTWPPSAASSPRPFGRSPKGEDLSGTPAADVAARRGRGVPRGVHAARAERGACRRCRGSGTRRTTAPSSSRRGLRAAARARTRDRARGVGAARARPARLRRGRHLLHGRADGPRRAAVPVARRRRLSEHLPRRRTSALVLLLRAARRGVSRRCGSTGWSARSPCAAVGAALVLGVVASTEGSLAAVATNLAYPLGDLIAAGVRDRRDRDHRPAAGLTWRCSALAFAVWAVADVVYLYQAALGTYREYTLLDTAGRPPTCWSALAACRPAGRLDARRLRGGCSSCPRRSRCSRSGCWSSTTTSRLNEVADLARLAARSSPRSCASR